MRVNTPGKKSLAYYINYLIINQDLLIILGILVIGVSVQFQNMTLVYFLLSDNRNAY